MNPGTVVYHLADPRAGPGDTAVHVIADTSAYYGVVPNSAGDKELVRVDADGLALQYVMS